MRGLKCLVVIVDECDLDVAPFTGAWIEIDVDIGKCGLFKYVAPFTGAWIEIGAMNAVRISWDRSHPSRVRGLKSTYQCTTGHPHRRRTLHGCVD